MTVGTLEIVKVNKNGQPRKARTEVPADQKLAKWDEQIADSEARTAKLKSERAAYASKIQARAAGLNAALERMNGSAQ